MRFYEFATAIKKPPTPQQARLDTLKTQKDNVGKALDTERKRQKVAKARQNLTKALSAELAPTIRVNCIAPSLTDTPLAASLLNNEQKVEANAQRHPLKRVGTVQDMSEMSCFLLSTKSSWITGQILHIDGGMSSIKL